MLENNYIYIQTHGFLQCSDALMLKDNFEGRNMGKYKKRDCINVKLR